MMQRFYVNLTTDLNQKIEQKAWVTKKPKAVIVREALEIGLREIHSPKSTSAQALLNLALLAQQIPTKGSVPADAVKNMDYYTWGGEKRE